MDLPAFPMRRLAPWIALLPALTVPACAPLREAAWRTSQPAAAAPEGSLTRLADATSEAVDNPLASSPEGTAPTAATSPLSTAGSPAAEIKPVAYQPDPDPAPVLLTGPVAAPQIDGFPAPATLPSASGAVPPGGEGIRFEELEQIALANNPSVQQAEAIVGKARGIHAQVGLHPNPTVGYLANEMGDAGTAGIQGAFLSQTIVTAGKLRKNRAIAARQIQNLRWELEAQRQRVRNAVRIQGFELLGAQRRIAVTNDLVEVAEKGVTASQELLSAGQVARPDLLQARIQLNEVRILWKNAQYDYEAAWTQLASLIGRPEMAPRPLAGSLSPPAEPAEPFEERLAALLATSPQMQAARVRLQRARAQIDRQRVQPIPNIVAQVGVAHDNASGDDIANLQLGLPIPVFNRNQGAIQLAHAELRRAASDLHRTELSLRNALAVAFREYQKRANQVQQYRDQIVPTAEENLNLSEEGYRQGEFDLIRVLTARRSYFESNLSYIDAQVAMRQADVTINGWLLVGGLDDVADTAGSNLQGIGLRGQAFSQQ